MRVTKSFGLAACFAAILAVRSSPVLAEEKRALNDAELDAITAGTASASEDGDLLMFEAITRTASGKTIAVEGSLEIAESLRGITLGTLTLSDNAQSNLQSLININAVNSAVNVLLNLNVTVDSSVGTVNQLNLSDRLPPITLTTRP